MEIRRPFCFFTPSKINFFLHIQKKRPDGFHEVLLDMIPVAFFDRIELFPASGKGVWLESDLPGVKPEDNLAVRAVRLLEAETNEKISLKIKLHKNVPAGAGLGGGSANAAGILTVLNQLLDLKLSAERLREAALTLGTDVPFFIEPRPCLAKGAGEKLSFLPEFPPVYLILIFPGFSIPTSEAYKHCNISGSGEIIADYSPRTLASFTPEMNDFWPWLSARRPVLAEIRESLIRAGAVAAGLSGSGSSMFGVFADRKKRDQAPLVLKPGRGARVVPCRTINRHRYL